MEIAREGMGADGRLVKRKRALVRSVMEMVSWKSNLWKLDGAGD
jgi:hypothetical protein